MAYLSPYYNSDVFISYSHGDLDREGKSLLKNWSKAFAAELEQELRLLPKFRDVAVFRDEDERPSAGLDPISPLTKQLEERIATSAILAILMSDNYLESSWCKAELAWWTSCQRAESAIETARAFVARILPTDAQKWPKALLDERNEAATAYWFYDRSNINDSTRPFEWPDPTNARGPFRAELLRMVGRLGQALEEFRHVLSEREHQRQQSAPTSGGEQPILYLHAREKHAQLFEATWTELDNRGFKIEPAAPEPTPKDDQDEAELEQERLRRLRRCHALLLLGSDPLYLDTDMGAIGFDSRNSAQSRYKRPLPCAVLNKAGPSLRTPVRSSLASRYGITWIDASPPAWPSNLSAWLSAFGIGA